MEIEKSTQINRWFTSGFILITCAPTALFYLSFLFKFDAKNANLVILSRALRTSFPNNAQVFILTGLVALFLSHIPLVKFASSLNTIKLIEFSNNVMRTNLKTRKKSYRIAPLVVAALVSLVSIATFIFGPVDMSIMCANVACISKSPMLFVVTQTLLLFLVYMCNACILVWITAYIKLERLK